MSNFLPKSLHTVRILVAVARHNLPSGVAGDAKAAIGAIQSAARIVGYPDASPRDPLIVKAALQFAAE